MSEHGRGTFSCRIDGRAGYLRLFDDRIELVRSGRRGPDALGADVLPMYQVTQVALTKPGRMLSTVGLVAAGCHVELKFPSVDAPRVADLIELLARDAVAPAELPVELPAQVPYVDEPALVPAYAAEASSPAAPVAIPAPVPVFPPLSAPEVDLSFLDELLGETPLTGAPVANAVSRAAADPVVSAFVVPAEPEEGRAFELSTIRIPELVIPEILMPEWRPLPQDDEFEPMPALVVPKVTMPEWTPLPETEEHEMVLSQIVINELAPWSPTPEPVAVTEPITEIAPLPDGSVLAAAAALASLEDLLSGLEPIAAAPGWDDLDEADGVPVPRTPVVYDGEPVAIDPADDIVAMAREILAPVAVSGDASIPAQPSEAALTLAAAALLSGAMPPADEPAPKPVVTRPAEMSPELTKRHSRLETLRDCGVMSEEDFKKHESEIFELAWAEQKTV